MDAGAGSVADAVEHALAVEHADPVCDADHDPVRDTDHDPVRDTDAVQDREAEAG